MRFLVDHCVPVSVGRFLSDQGHDVSFVKDVLATDAPDKLVARQAAIDDRILITQDNDFNRLVVPAGAGKGRRFHYVNLAGQGPDCLCRMQQALSLIEFEWGIANERPDSRLSILIRNRSIRTDR